MDAIKVSNLSKKFKKESRSFFTTLKYLFKPDYIQVLEDINFDIKKSEIFGFLGPNGAGKTTLIKIILGLVEPDVGEVKIFDYKIPDEIEKIKEKINAVFARGGVYWPLTLKENIEWFGKIYRIKNLDEKIESLIEIFELKEKADTFADRCSTGELMRMKLARALINDPEILILDEPTIGLDPSIALKVREFIKKLNKERKTTIVLTTHQMAEADILCDRIAIMNKGKIVAKDRPKKLKGKLKRKNIIEMDVRNINQKILNKIKKLDGVLGLEYTQEKEELRLITEALDVLDEIINVLKKNRVKFYSVHTEEPSLEDVFLYITGRGL
jgi:ABC-2 type transport system ATP-binding protein